MKIISLAISNIMKITAAFIKPTSDVVLIQGDNAQGKSSVLDSIIMAFAEKNSKTFPKEPIKKGAKKGNIEIHMDGDSALGIPPFVITRTITPTGTTLKIEPEEILNGETPRSFMDKIIGSISFDPLSFINNEPKKQRKILLELIGVDVDELDRKEKEIFDSRTIKGRDLKIQEAKIKGLVNYPDVKETEEIKIAELSTKLTRAMNWNQDIKNRESANEKLKNAGVTTRGKIEGVKEQITNLQTELEHLEALLSNQKKEFITEREAIAELEPVDIESINTEIQSIESTNTRIRANATYKSELANLKSLQAAYDAIDTNLECVRADRLKLIADAPIPVDGLTFDEDGLLYNSIPLSQCSDGEKLMVSLGISMALNPTMKVLRIKDGSLLGPTNMKILAKMVKDKGYQIFIEKVMDKTGYDAAGKIGIFIQEGEIIEADGVEVDNTPEPAKPASKGKLAPAAPNPVTEPDW